MGRVPGCQRLAHTFAHGHRPLTYADSYAHPDTDARHLAAGAPLPMTTATATSLPRWVRCARDQVATGRAVARARGQ
jgi:hypothetical protein